MQRTEHQPRRRVVRLLARDLGHLGDGVTQALGLRQHPCVGQPDGRLCLGVGQIGLDDGLGSRGPAHQVQRGEGGADGVGLGLVGSAQQGQGFGGFTCPQPHAAQGRVRGHAGGRGLLVRLQHAVQHRGHGLEVGGLVEEARDGGDQRTALAVRAAAEQGAQGLGRICRTIQGADDLQLQLDRLQRIWKRLAPGPHGRQCAVARPSLQRDVRGATEQLLVTGTAGSVQQHLESHGRLALAQFQLPDHQLIEQQGIQCRPRGCFRGFSGLRCGRSLWACGAGCWRVRGGLAPDCGTRQGSQHREDSQGRPVPGPTGQESMSLQLHGAKA